MDNEQNKLDIIDQKLEELRNQIEKMEKEHAELFADLGIGPHQLQDYLNDRTRHSPEAYEFIQKERKALQDVLDERLEKTRAKLLKKHPPEPIGGHWIFVR